MLPAKFLVNWPFGSGEEVKNKFSRWLSWQPSSISDWNDFSYFWSTSHSNAIRLSVREKKRKIDFQDGGHGGHLGFPIGMILTIFNLQVTPMPATKVRVNWPVGSGEEVKDRFSYWPPWQPPWISDLNDFSYVWATSHPDVSYQVSSQVTFRFRRRSENRFSRWPPS